MAVGLIVHADQAEQILQEGRVDLIALARELLYNPTDRHEGRLAKERIVRWTVSFNRIAST
jgi:2,4-dienoyl-CoA reductase-like NADH-dependent reductase (Old Yellow Enzyme family)